MPITLESRVLHNKHTYSTEDVTIADYVRRPDLFTVFVPYAYLITD